MVKGGNLAEKLTEEVQKINAVEELGKAAQEKKRWNKMLECYLKRCLKAQRWLGLQELRRWKEEFPPRFVRTHGVKAMRKELKERFPEKTKDLEPPLHMNTLKRKEEMLWEYYVLSRNSNHWLKVREIEESEELYCYQWFVDKFGGLTPLRELATKKYCHGKDPFATLPLTEDNLVRLYYERCKAKGKWLDIYEINEDEQLPGLGRLYKVTTIQDMRYYAQERYGEL